MSKGKKLGIGFLVGWRIFISIEDAIAARQPEIEVVEAGPQPSLIVTNNAIKETKLEYSDAVIVAQFEQYGIPLETLRYVAGEVLNGRPLSYEEFTPKENGLSDGQMKSFQSLMLKYRFAEWKTPGEHKPGMTPTTAGISFFERITGRTTTHPSKEDA